MTNEEVQLHIKVIFHNPNVSFKAKDVANKTELVIVVTKDSVAYEYDPIKYLVLLFAAYTTEMDHVEMISDKVDWVYKAKNIIVNNIENFKRHESELKTVTYDYDSVINRVNAAIERVRFELDAKKYELELDKLSFETNKFVKWLPFILSGLATLISLSSLVISLWISSSGGKTPSIIQVNTLQKTPQK